jgi:ABC-2 type transport system ATP-binding protein
VGRVRGGGPRGRLTTCGPFGRAVGPGVRDDADVSDAAAIVAEGLEKRFGVVRALDGLTLTVRGGEILGLIGPNGAGKSTFIRTVAGLVAPNAGTITVLGERPGPHVAARIGYMTQSAALYEDLSVRENLAFFGRVYGLRTGEAVDRGDALLSLLRLTEKTNRPVHELSGGQRQLANLACAMVHAPTLLLLDEPTVGVDPELRRRLWTEFSSLRDAGTTILVTTHVMDEADRCDRVAFVADGRVLDVGTAADLLTRHGVTTVEDAFLKLRTEDGS